MLLALTGFGNAALKGLMATGRCSDCFVVTRQESGPFPYYPCRPLTELCREEGVRYCAKPNLNSAAAAAFLGQWKPDLILSATFHQLVPVVITSMAGFGAVNIHPSLLPRYRGPTPTQWAIAEGERQTGITYHLLTPIVDAGPILYQVGLEIGREMTDGELRRNLAVLVEANMPTFLSNWLGGKLNPVAQSEGNARYYPRIASPQGMRLLENGDYSAKDIERALTPYPGAFAYMGKDFKNALSE